MRVVDSFPLGNEEKAGWAARLADEFTVISEVGFKDVARSAALASPEWISSIRADLDAGAKLVTTEARESGRGGICTADGQPRDELVEAILASGVDVDRLLFEAPTKELQTYFVRRLGPSVNVGNIPPRTSSRWRRCGWACVRTPWASYEDPGRRLPPGHPRRRPRRGLRVLRHRPGVQAGPALRRPDHPGLLR
jgi:hypothetical protein